MPAGVHGSCEESAQYANGSFSDACSVAGSRLHPLDASSTARRDAVEALAEIARLQLYFDPSGVPEGIEYGMRNALLPIGFCGLPWSKVQKRERGIAVRCADEMRVPLRKSEECVDGFVLIRHGVS